MNSTSEISRHSSRMSDKDFIVILQEFMKTGPLWLYRNAFAKNKHGRYATTSQGRQSVGSNQVAHQAVVYDIVLCDSDHWSGGRDWLWVPKIPLFPWDSPFISNIFTGKLSPTQNLHINGPPYLNQFIKKKEKRRNKV